MYTPINPTSSILKWGVRGSSLHGQVSIMCVGTILPFGIQVESMLTMSDEYSRCTKLLKQPITNVDKCLSSVVRMLSRQHISMLMPKMSW